MVIVVDPSPLPATRRIDLSEEPDFDLGGMGVLPSERAVVLNGERRELQPRVMQVLVALAKARPQVVSRDRLVELCWDGRVVGDDALNRCILALRHLAQDFTPQPYSIETVPRVGHRLVANGEADRVEPRAAKPAQWGLAVLAAVLLAVLAAGVFLWQQRGAAPGPASIAVLPFRNLGSGDPYFAEGIGEEILGQLAREPHFRVAGSSSSSQFGKTPDVREVARRLDVDYILEGSVRRQGGRVRVSANLVSGRDGTQMWSDSYDGRLDDIFAIQREIGAAIASALRRRLVRAPPLAGPLVTRGEVYNLYLTARGLLRTRDRRVGPTAAGLLRDALNMDPGYAPAWASLAEATQFSGALSDNERYARAMHARAYARRAIQLAPDLAQAHRAYGQLFGYGSRESLAHLRRAAELDPKDPENLIALGEALGANGEFEQQLAMCRQAHELDPLWFRTVGCQGIFVAEMGDRAEAEAIARRGFRDMAIQQNLLMGRIAWIVGDFSEAYRRWQMIVRSGSPRWGERVQISMDDTAFLLGLKTVPPPDLPQPIWSRRVWPVRMQEAPAPAVWRLRNGDPVRAEVYRLDNLIAAKLMLNSGRAAELAATFRGPTGLLGIRRGQPVRTDQVDAAPIVALALREGGEAAEADRILREAEERVRAVYRKGRPPFWFDADAAAVFAVRGREEEALAALERALGRGWTHSGPSDLGGLESEPAFASIREHPRFKRIAQRLAAHYARERAELSRLLKA
ncbi:MAG TPA: winged helix-turn-helix domain-containing protein [Sphingomicrobium sp.]|nr:winged helix-turn-helix domain-containing protein [Sphingomicrobium sp.]